LSHDFLAISTEPARWIIDSIIEVKFLRLSSRPHGIIG